jgi:mRNA-degrading endonuclease YafQ of YafQ-DinJ toxin-antitoxin module
MWHLVWTRNFRTRCRKLLPRNRELGEALTTTLALLVEDPRQPRLKLHRLHGELEGLWVVRVTYSVRLVIGLNESQHEITLLALGSHDEVYR